MAEHNRAESRGPAPAAKTQGAALVRDLQESGGDQRRGGRAPDNPGASNRHGPRRATQRIAPIGLKACRRNNRISRIF